MGLGHLQGHPAWGTSSLHPRPSRGPCRQLGPGQTWPPSPVSTWIGSRPCLRRLLLGGAPQPRAPGDESGLPGCQAASARCLVSGETARGGGPRGLSGALGRQHAGREGWWPVTAHAPPWTAGPAYRPPRGPPHRQWALEGPWAGMGHRSPTHSPGGRSCHQTQNKAPGTDLG